MVILLMGVSGSGKTTIGKMLADSLKWQFQDADDYHPSSNIEKMRQGIPLTDSDRQPWLESLQKSINEWLKTETQTILACSALKSSYRELLQSSVEVKFVYLKGSFEIIQQRLNQRSGHYMNPNLLKSQFEALEEPVGVIQIDIEQPPKVIVQQIRQELMI